MFKTAALQTGNFATQTKPYIFAIKVYQTTYILLLVLCLFLSHRNSIGEILGWASAQVVCICSINPQKIVVIDNTSKQSNHQVSFSTNITSLSPSRGERGVVIFSTNPKILVCDLKLSKDTCMECKFHIYTQSFQK